MLRNPNYINFEPDSSFSPPIYGSRFKVSILVKALD